MQFLSFMRGLTVCALIVSATGLAGCGSTGVQNVKLATAAVPSSNARLKISRTNDLLYIGAAATVDVNGKSVATLGAGGSTYIDVPAGRHATIAVYTWSYPGKFSVRIKAAPGQRYNVVVSPREESFVVAAAFGILGGALDAAVNENSGAFKLQFTGKS